MVTSGAGSVVIGERAIHARQSATRADSPAHRLCVWDAMTLPLLALAPDTPLTETHMPMEVASVGEAAKGEEATDSAASRSTTNGGTLGRR